MKGIVAEGEELMPHRSSQAAPSTGENNPPEAEVPLATQNGRIPHPEPEVPLAAQRTPIKKLCRNQGLVLQDETVTTGTQKIMEEETSCGSP
jgi:non-structural maintenance of chromosomes element 4